MKRRHKIIKNNTICMENEFLIETLERALNMYTRTQDVEHLVNTITFIIEDLKDGSNN